MRSNTSVYVDAGYLLASAATRVTGTSLRNGVYVDYPALVGTLIQEAEQVAGLPVLRVHWYDSAKNGVPDAQQERIGEIPKVKLRLGRFGVDGQQKGVDLRMGLDLVTHARNQAADVFVLVSGDDDLTEAVEEAQVHGVQVVVLAVPNARDRPHGVSRYLLRAADALATIAPESVDAAVQRVEVPAAEVAPEVPAPTPVARPSIPTPNDLTGRPRPAPEARPSVLAYSATSNGRPYVVATHELSAEWAGEIDSVATNVLRSLRESATPQDLAALRTGRPSIPNEIDRALLLDLSNTLGVWDLSDVVRYQLRDRFWALFDQDATA